MRKLWVPWEKPHEGLSLMEETHPSRVRLFLCTYLIYLNMMNTVKDPLLNAFPPILPERPHTLVLGTMPGGKSLEMNQYYAHPQNQFWRFMGDIFGADKSLPYGTRVNILKQHHIAVWDVLSSCTRIGSMDANIKNAVVNDFSKFYQDHPTIDLVIFDSLTAENYYLKYALPRLLETPAANLIYKRVPSPSPAHARLSYAEKLLIWQEAFSRK